ncbi:MAG: polyprenyl synthetase family protein, partial [Microcoleus sp. SIO2G3]|nr:polyprenyl synthetase family protein [Microcoleus sp. SIO2G3]
IEESKRQAQQLVQSAKAELDVYGEAARPLQAIADYITARNN